jgi:hypothetical protein
MLPVSEPGRRPEAADPSDPTFGPGVRLTGLLAFRLLLVGGADLDELRLGSNLGLYVSLQLAA